MALEHANQGAVHTAQRVTWTLSDGAAQNLSGAVVSARITPVLSPVTEAFASDGTFTPVAGEEADGVFDWEYGAADVGNWGEFLVQFKALYGTEYDLSDPAAWTVKKAA